MNYAQEQAQRARNDEMLEWELERKFKKNVFNVWVDDKLVPSSQWHLYLDENGDWLEEE